MKDCNHGCGHNAGAGETQNSSSRRDFLKLVAGAGAMIPAAGLMAQAPSPTPRTPAGRVDVHHHPQAPEFVRRRLSGNTGNTRNWSPASSIEQMDKYGIATAITSRPDIWKDDNKEAVELSRACNEYGAEMVRDHPGRFGLFASLPFPDPDATLKEIQYAFDVLKADGATMVSSYGDKWAGDPIYTAIYEELNRRKAVVFMHPIAPYCCQSGLVPGVSRYMVEYDFDLARGVVSLLVNGVFSRFPDIRFIFAHSGGTLPVLAGRINDRFPKDRAASAPQGVPYELKRLYFEVAHATFGPPLAALLKLVPPSQILFGTDYPMEPIESTTKPLAEFGLLPKDLAMIERGTAERLFPRLRA